jgi:hypothetical protein
MMMRMMLANARDAASGLTIVRRYSTGSIKKWSRPDAQMFNAKTILVKRSLPSRSMLSLRGYATDFKQTPEEVRKEEEEQTRTQRVPCMRSHISLPIWGSGPEWPRRGAAQQCVLGSID